MKQVNILYWIFTILFGGYMLFTALPNAMNNEESIQLIHGYLGYPKYIIPFLGYAKILGALAILIPGFLRIKEWAYAGLMFDLVLATYSIMVVGGDAMGFIFMVLPIIVGGLSYFYLHKKINLSASK